MRLLFQKAIGPIAKYLGPLSAIFSKRIRVRVWGRVFQKVRVRVGVVGGRDRVRVGRKLSEKMSAMQTFNLW